MAKIFCLMGPTASGKTALAMQMVQAHPFEIISVDSALIYREMNIGTAKPTAAELALAPHHLIDILDPTDSYSAASFCNDVKCLVQEIRLRGNTPLLVGGTMMYYNALQNGLSQLPEADPLVRTALLTKAEQQGWQSLYQQLQQCDPESALRINPNDSHRLIRALEVFQITGKPLTAFRQLEKDRWDVEFINIILFPENRAWLHNRIGQRFDHMLDEGLIAETQALCEKWQLDHSHPAMRTVGYRQVLAYLANEYDSKTLREKGIAATRQLAKRQLTWLRSWRNVVRLDPEHLDWQQVARLFHN